MKKNKLRILSLLVALMMVLGLTGAMAEAPAAPTLGDIINNSGNVQFDVQISADPQSIAFLMAMSEGGAMPDEAGMTMLTTLVNAINKIKATIVTNKTGLSGVLATDKGELLDFQATFDEKTFENQVTSSFLPGLVLSLDPAILKEGNPGAAASQMTQEQALQMLEPYIKAVNAYFDTLTPNIVTEEGTFEFEKYGTFTSKTPVVITTYMIGDLLQALADTYKTDEGLKTYLEQSMASAQSAMAEMEALTEGSDSEDDAESPKDLGASLEGMAQMLKYDEDKPVFAGSLYKNENGFYADFASPPEEQSSLMKLDLAVNDDKAGNIKVSNQFITASVVPEYSPEGTPIQKEIDWADVEQQIKTGMMMGGSIVTVDVTSKMEQPTLSSNICLGFFSMGMNFNLTIDSVSRMDKLEGTSTITLATDAPLITITISSAQTEDAPKAPLLDGATPLTITEGELPEEEQQILSASAQKAVAALMDRLSTCLPDEAPALLKLIRDAMGIEQGQPAPAPAP